MGSPGVVDGSTRPIWASGAGNSICIRSPRSRLLSSGSRRRKRSSPNSGWKRAYGSGRGFGERGSPSSIVSPGALRGSPGARLARASAIASGRAEGRNSSTPGTYRAALPGVSRTISLQRCRNAARSSEPASVDMLRSPSTLVTKNHCTPWANVIRGRASVVSARSPISTPAPYIIAELTRRLISRGIRWARRRMIRSKISCCSSSRASCPKDTAANCLARNRRTWSSVASRVTSNWNILSRYLATLRSLIPMST